jgi:hypothetical protein
VSGAACARCGPQDGARLFKLFGLLLCPACSRDARDEISARASALATERAERIAAKRIAAYVPIEDRDPLDRVMRAAFLAAGETGVFEVARAVLSHDLPGRIAANLRTAIVGRQVFIEAGPGPRGELAYEDALELQRYAVGRAAGHYVAAQALCAAIELLADPACDLRGVLLALRDAVDRVRDCETIRGAAERLMRGDRPLERRWRPRVIDVRRIPRTYHAGGSPAPAREGRAA